MPTAPAFKIRFPTSKIPEWSDKYTFKTYSDVERIAAGARARGYLTRDDLLGIIRWKASRALPLAKTNDADYVQAVSGVSLGTTSERLRIEVLTLLRGVSWPIASVILHFCADGRYPILDFRALWSVGLETRGNPPRYCFELWEHYTRYCRELADGAGVTMRVLDRALWQYSAEMQPRGYPRTS